MTDSFTKEDLAFLVDAMEQHFMSRGARAMTRGGPAPTAGANDKVNGDMSIPQPIQADVNDSMSADDYKACAMVMAVCQNMVQKSITDAAKAAGIPAADALKNMNAWVQGYVDFPFPFFNFKDTQSDVYKKDDFSLKTDPDVVEKVVNIKNVAGLKDAVTGALKSAGGNLASYENSERHFNYFGVITAYLEREISFRVIKFQMNMKSTKVDSLCVHYSQTALDTTYDTYQFVADKDMMIKMQSKMGDKLVDYMADKLLQFVKDFYDQQFTDFQRRISEVLKK